MNKRDRIFLVLYIVMAIAVAVWLVACASTQCTMSPHRHRSVDHALKFHQVLTLVAIRPDGITVRDQFGTRIDIPTRGHPYTGGDLNHQVP